MRLVVFLAFLGAAPVQAQLSTAQIARIDSVFGRFTRADAPGCVLGIGSHGRVVYERGYGLADLEHDAPLSARSIVEIGSVSKQFTTASVLLLAQDGKLSLDDDIRKWVPTLPDFGSRITIRMLANHTSGLRDQWGLLGLLGNGPGTQEHSNALILELLSRQQDLNFPPNDQYLYSNSGFVILAEIVQRASGQTLAQFSSERIFKPLGMHSTQWRDDHQRVVKGRALAYTAGDGTYRTEMPFTNVYGNGGLLTTVGDLIIWWDALMNDRLGQPGFLNEMTRRAVLNNGNQIGYALGLSVAEYRGLREISHGGSTAGYRAHLAAYPDARTSIAVLCNRSDGGPAALLARVADVVLADKLGAAARPPAIKAAPVPAEVHAARAGLYRNPSNEEVIRLEARPDRLVVTGTPIELLPIGPDSYQRASSAQQIRFTRENGRVQLDRGLAEGYPDVFEKVEAVTLSAGRLAEYAGRYRSPELDYQVELKVENNALVIDRPGIQPTIRLSPTFRDGFTGGGYVVFTRDPSGKVTGFKLTQGRIRHVRFARL